MQAIISFPEKKEEIKALKAFLNALKIRFEQKDVYGSDFVEKINSARKSYERGDYITIDDTSNIWQNILSE